MAAADAAQLLAVVCDNPCCICSSKADAGQPLYACERCYLKCGAEHIDAFDGAMHPLCFIQWAPRTCPLCRTKLQFQNEYDIITEAVLAATAADLQPDLLTAEEDALNVAAAIELSLQAPPIDTFAGAGAGAAPRVRGVRRCRKCAGGPLLLGHSCPNRKRKAQEQ